MANEQTSVTRVADREELPLLLDCLTFQAATMNWWTLALPSVMRRFQATGAARDPAGLTRRTLLKPAFIAEAVGLPTTERVNAYSH